MNRVGWRNILTRPNCGVAVRRLDVEGEQLHGAAFEEFSYTLSLRLETRFVRSRQYLANRENAGAERVVPFAHPPINLFNLRPIFRMSLKPVDEQHRVPVDEAHFRSASSP